MSQAQPLSAPREDKMRTPVRTARTEHAIDWQAPLRFGVTVAQKVSLAPYTTMKVGGAAEYFATVSTVDQLIRLVRWARAGALPYFLLGGGSNILISDAGVRGLVIYNRCRQVRVDAAPCCAFPRDDRPFVFAESGGSMAGLARRMVSAGLSGLEWAVSLPGTVGGAVVNNAGAYGGAVQDNLYDAMILGADGDIEEVLAEQLAYAYRASRLKQIPVETVADAPAAVHAGFGPVVLSANFRLTPGDGEAIKTQAEQNLHHRRRTQPVEPSLGSSFVNPPGDYAGRLIEAAGLKGISIGGVQVSRRHANFLINPGGVGAATASDVMKLIAHVQRVVEERFGVWLTPEVQFVGDWERS
ncbi:UDP-N-acetylmuramate dehydrogenase [Caldilinea sp.]|uniref:UDP-N-acetylmuramate dehydrogenase n=1 Tax=Caldilinea sp. TaxID=2293560 RepID=UPI002D191C6B|nr:UDP-N-acetylmuramate dehydrogenase [Anaerolineales bacterium]HQY90408.1 UDP-N-acetylmuramate dehydrogenase [Caldilinea sp.]HRA66565.1 UDP-N-acetylmuramate dehydrogenase [Caldilinea sp.]